MASSITYSILAGKLEKIVKTIFTYDAIMKLSNFINRKLSIIPSTNILTIYSMGKVVEGQDR